mmetsp:Transcript_6994/g.11033  ORF Transcript_6994/g.11033 Transcript_6994/m.11033 type:complete len:261 (-) Transcript_6994:332-1114(-)
MLAHSQGRSPTELMTRRAGEGSIRASQGMVVNLHRSRMLAVSVTDDIKPRRAKGCMPVNEGSNSGVPKGVLAKRMFCVAVSEKESLSTTLDRRLRACKYTWTESECSRATQLQKRWGNMIILGVGIQSTIACKVTRISMAKLKGSSAGSLRHANRSSRRLEQASLRGVGWRARYICKEREARCRLGQPTAQRRASTPHLSLRSRSMVITFRTERAIWVTSAELEVSSLHKAFPLMAIRQLIKSTACALSFSASVVPSSLT